MMKTFPIRVLSALLVLLMLLPAFSACSEKKNEPEETSGNPGDANAPEAGAEEPEADPDNVLSILAAMPEANYNGYEMISWARNVINSTLSVRQVPDEELSGEPINDALWQRDRAVEEKYNVKLSYVIPDLSGLSLYKDASKLILSGDDSMSVIYGTMATSESPSFMSEGLILDMTSIPNIDLTKPYWSQNANTTLAIKGKVYLCTGDVTCRYAGAPYLFLFNKKLMEDYAYELPYDAVREGKWTFDSLEKMVEGTYRDLNGNGKRETTDYYGYASEDRNSYAFYKGFGFDSVRFTDAGVEITCGTETAINAIERITGFYAKKDLYFAKVVYEETGIFKEDRCLFVGQTACNLVLLTDMETDFGVLPSPKWEESQSAYYSYVNPHCATAVMIPKSVSDPDRTGMILEALAAASRVTSMKQAYEITLQLRQTRDRDSVEMLRIASEAAVYDLSEIYGWGGLYSVMTDCMLNNKSFTSKLRSLNKLVTKAAERSIEKLLGD